MAAWMLYGANGYTGEIIAKEAKARGMTPVLAARRADAVRPIAESLGLTWKAFPLDDPAAVAKELDGMTAVLHCAGPFSKTSAPMVEACLRAGVHYMDITGEIDVFEAVHRRDADAKARKVSLIAGVGFDVVPSDCLAALVARELPGATSLEIAFGGAAGVSRGTATTALEGLGKGGIVRENGVIKQVPWAHAAKVIQFSDKTRFCVAIPWGDVSTAYHSTGIPNVTTFIAMPRNAVRGMKLMRLFAPVLGLPQVQELLKKQVQKNVTGPDEAARARGKMQLWARVDDGKGRSVEGTATTPEGYRLTMLAALECTSRILKGGIAHGALTPSKAFGAELLKELPECSVRI